MRSSAAISRVYESAFVEIDPGRRIEVEGAGRAGHAGAVVVPLARSVELVEAVLDELRAVQPLGAAVAERPVLLGACS